MEQVSQNTQTLHKVCIHTHNFLGNVNSDFDIFTHTLHITQTLHIPLIVSYTHNIHINTILNNSSSSSFYVYVCKLYTNFTHGGLLNGLF